MPPRSGTRTSGRRSGAPIYFAGFTLVGSTLLGLAMALVLNQRFAGRGLLRSFVLVPWAMAPVSVGVLWSFVYAGDYGALTGLLNDLGLRAVRAAVARRRLSRPQSRRPHAGLEPGAADDADAAGGACSRCRQPAPRRDAGRRRPGRPFLRHHAALAEAKFSLHLDRDDHQFADGLRHSLDHDARGPRRGDDGAVLARLSHGLPVPAIRRRREPPVFPHGAELPAGDRLFRGVRPAARPSASPSTAVDEAQSASHDGARSRLLRLLRPRSELTGFGARCPRRFRARSAAAASRCWPSSSSCGPRFPCSRSSS